MQPLGPARPVWTDHTNTIPDTTRPDLIRVGPRGAAGLVILSARYWGTPVHFWRARSTPHLEPQCPACLEGNTKRETFWVPVCSVTTLKLYVFEITKGAIHTLDEWLAIRSTLRGAQILATRRGARDKGKLFLTLSHSKMPEAALPEAFDVRDVLDHMWETNTRTTNPPPPTQDYKDTVNRIAEAETLKNRTAPHKNGKHK